MDIPLEPPAIDLRNVSERDYKHVIEAALTYNGFFHEADALHAANVRDLMEMWLLLPEGTIILLEDRDERAVSISE